MTVFYVLGGALALWAVVLSALGIARHKFPGGKGGERVVVAISSILVAGAVVSAIVSGVAEDEEEAEAQAEAAAEEPAPEAVAGGEQVELSADPGGDLAFDADALEAPAGPVTLTMANPAAIEHNVALEGGGVAEQGETVPQDGTSTVSAELAAGEYAFFCSVPGHREGGMEGTLTVE